MSDIDCVAAGWAVDPEDPETEVAVRILADEVEVLSGIAALPRPDVVDAGIDTDNESGFFFDLHDVLPAGTEVSIRAQAQDLADGTWYDLSETPKVLLCTGMGGFHDWAFGDVRRLDCVATGWTRDRHDPSRRVAVRVSVDGDLVAETTADEFRQDILDAGLSDGYSGWTVDLWDIVQEGTTARVHAEALDEDSGLWFVLSDTDREITCHDWTDAIFVKDLRTGVERRVTDLPRTGEYNPAWSPDGKLIAHDVVDDLGHILYVTDVRTGASRPVPGEHLANDPSWSPDGKRVVIDRLPADDPSVFRIDIRTGAADFVVGDAFDADWHPEASRIVFVRPSSNGLVVRDLRTGAETPLLTLGAGVPEDVLGRLGVGINPSWSPDGRWVVYSDGADLFKIRVTGTGNPSGAPVQLTETDAIENGPDWSGDGASIVFKSDATGDFAIYLMPATGGAATVLADASGIGDYDGAISVNNRYLAYSSFASKP